MKELLSCLCCYPYEPASRDRLKELLQRVDNWDQAALLINRHGITALAAYNIKEAGLTGMIPAGTMTMLEGGWKKSLVRNAWLTERWKEVNKILSGSGIRHVLLKGMALEYSVYGGQGLRQMNDTDILVKRDEALKAWNLLQKNGYQPEMLKSSLYRKIITDTGKHLPSLTKDGYSVELHHRLFFGADRNKTLENAIDNAREIDVEGTRAYILQDDIHLEYLRSHLQMHMMTGIFQLRLRADIEIIRPGSAPVIPASFILDPVQKPALSQRKEFYRTLFLSVPAKSRLRYLAGDIFPSLAWLKKRHNCSTLGSLFYYPRRLAKLFWLAGGRGRSSGLRA